MLDLRRSSIFASQGSSTGKRYLEPGNVPGEEVVGRAATPVHYVFVLAATSQLPVPVGDTEVGLDEGLTQRTIADHGVEERLVKEEERGKGGG